jgi:hypothetical protein
MAKMHYINQTIVVKRKYFLKNPESGIVYPLWGIVYVLRTYLLSKKPARAGFLKI